MTAVQGKKYLSTPVVFNGKASLPRGGGWISRWAQDFTHSTTGKAFERERVPL